LAPSPPAALWPRCLQGDAADPVEAALVPGGFGYLWVLWTSQPVISTAGRNLVGAPQRDFSLARTWQWMRLKAWDFRACLTGSCSARMGRPPRCCRSCSCHQTLGVPSRRSFAAEAAPTGGLGLVPRGPANGTTGQRVPGRPRQRADAAALRPPPRFRRTAST